MNILVTQKQNFTPKRVTPTCHQPTLNINMLPLFHSELLLSTFFYHVRFLQAIWREGIMPQEQKPRSRHGRDVQCAARNCATAMACYLQLLQSLPISQA